MNSGDEQRYWNVFRVLCVFSRKLTLNVQGDSESGVTEHWGMMKSDPIGHTGLYEQVTVGILKSAMIRILLPQKLCNLSLQGVSSSTLGRQLIASSK